MCCANLFYLTKCINVVLKQLLSSGQLYNGFDFWEIFCHKQLAVNRKYKIALALYPTLFLAQMIQKFSGAHVFVPDSVGIVS